MQGGGVRGGWVRWLRAFGVMNESSWSFWRREEGGTMGCLRESRQSPPIAPAASETGHLENG